MNPNMTSPYGSAQAQPPVPPQPVASTGAYAPSTQPSVVDPSRPPVQVPTYNNPSPVKTIIIVVLVLFVVGLSGLCAYLYAQYIEVSTDVDSQINLAVVEAENALTLKLQAQFEKEYKLPNDTFSGPEDYGNLSFPYPKTWSVYEEEDASSGTGDYVAYLHPLVVPADPSDNSTHVAITVTIKSNTTFDKVSETYTKAVEKGTMTVSTRDVNGATTKATIYTGIVKKEFQGIVALIKIRDKTAIIQTDSAEAYGEDFYNILDNLTFNS